MRTNNQQLESVQRRVARGEYQVSSDRVAEAILARIGVKVDDQELISERDGRALLRALTGLRAI